MRIQKNMSQMKKKKKQDKTTAKDLSEIEINNIPDKEFKVIIIKILTGLEKKVEDFSETLNKEKYNIKKRDEELK